MPANGRDAIDTGLILGLGRSSWKRKWQPVPVLLPGKSHGQRSLVGLQSMRLQRVGHDWATEHTQEQHIFFTYSGYEPYQIHDLQIFSIHRSCLFIPLIMFLWGIQAFNFDTVQTVFFLLLLPLLLGSYPGSPCQTWCHEAFLPCYFLRIFIVLGLMFRSFDIFFFSRSMCLSGS